MPLIPIFLNFLESNFGPEVVAFKGDKMNHPRVGHFFMTLDPAFFMDIEAFKKRMDDYVDLLHNSNRADNCPRIYVHGEKEFDIHEQRERDGIPLDAKTVESLSGFADELEEKIEFMD